MHPTTSVKYCAVVRMQHWTKEGNYHEMTNSSRGEDPLLLHDRLPGFWCPFRAVSLLSTSVIKIADAVPTKMLQYAGDVTSDPVRG